MSRLIKVINNETIEISDYRCGAVLYPENPPTLQNIKDQIENCKDWCVFKKTINPFVLYSEKQQLQSNWNSLREWLEDYIKLFDNPDIYEEQTLEDLKEVLDKMNELEGKDK